MVICTNKQNIRCEQIFGKSEKWSRKKNTKKTPTEKKNKKKKSTVADDIVGGNKCGSAVGQTTTDVWSAGSKGLTWDLMISMDPAIAEIRQARRNDVQDRPSILRSERMSLFLGCHDPRDPTTKGRTLPIELYFSVFLLCAASRFSGVSYGMVISMTTLVPAIENWTSGISRCPGGALLVVGAIPDLSRSLTSISCTLLWRFVFRGRETLQWLRTWKPFSGDWPQRRQAFVRSEDHGYPRSGRMSRRALCIAVQSAIFSSVRQESVLAMSSDASKARPWATLP